MITALDSSVLIDVIRQDPKFWRSSLQALQEARELGSLIVCPVVWAELAACFEQDLSVMHEFFLEAGICFDPFDQACAELAGKMWQVYRKQGGKRTHLVADFLIASHAQCREGRLLTRDRGFYRRYFKKLTLLEPRVT